MRRLFNSSNQRTGTGFAYDGNGNPTTYKGATCVFDPENRMTAYGTVLTAGYRGDGLRAWKQTASGRTYFLYDGIVPVCEMNSSGTVTAVNVFGGDGLVGRTGAANVYYVFDQQGNVAQRLNSSQSVTSSSTYDAYGAETTTGTPTDPFGYNAKWGYYFDRETGVYKCTFRDYDPSTGRWLTRDPISYGGDINLYSYCAARAEAWQDFKGTLHAVIYPEQPHSYMQDIYDIISMALIGADRRCKVKDGPPEIEFPSPYEWVAEESAKAAIVEVLPERAGPAIEGALTVASGAVALAKGVCACVPYRNRIADEVDGDFSYELSGN